MQQRVVEARLLCYELQSILRRMDLPDDDPRAYNDTWRDRIEGLLTRAYLRYERRLRLLAMEGRTA